MRLIDADDFKKKFTGAYEFMQRVIDEQPTVDAVKHGKWIFYKLEEDFAPYGYCCSICKSHNNNIPIEEGVDPKIYSGSCYCPTCGAKMDLE